MQKAMLKAGLITPELYQALTVSQVEEERRRSANAMRSTARNQTPNLTKLEGCTSVGEFRSIARELLVENPERISDVLRLAHLLRESDGGKRLIWQLFQIRDYCIQTSDANARLLFVRRALRRAGGLGSKGNPVGE